jgi:HK97 family phage prohead protease
MTTTTTEPIEVRGSAREEWERERLLEALVSYQRGLAEAPVVQRFTMTQALTPNEDRPLTVIASDESVDRMGDVVRADGWDLSAYKANPVFLWAHDYTRTPIGRSDWVGIDGQRLLATMEFAPTEFAREVETLYRQRFLRAVSVGFRARAFTFRKGPHGTVEGIEYTKQELVEISAVPVPANPQALARALDGGLAVPRLRGLFSSPEGSAMSGADAERVISGLRGLRESIRA